MTAPALLRFPGISFKYPTAPRPVMEHFSLDIASGTATAILGPNGAGKTTLLHLALGWLKPHGGKIELDGRPLTDYSRRELGRTMALVPQSERTPFEYSLLEFVLLGRAPYMEPLSMPGEEDYNQADEALARVGLSDMRHRSIQNLSGGERQLVLVARALAQKPRLLLLDEPTTHLDLRNKAILMTLLRQLLQAGVTILFSTHEPEVAAALATHLVLMREGQVLESGSLDEVFTGASLSRLYQLPVEVASISGRKVALWT